MPHAFILGGNGQIGLATAPRMLEAGWSVTLTHRARRGGRLDPMPGGADVVSVDREETGALARALGSGADVLIDVGAYGPEHARQLLAVQGAVGALVVVSSASVYCDEKGRTLDEAADTGFPELRFRSASANLRSSRGPRIIQLEKSSSNAPCSTKQSSL